MSKTARSGPARRRRIVALRLVVCLASLLVAAGVAECLVRIAEWSDPEFNRFFFGISNDEKYYVYDSMLGWKNAPSRSGIDADISVSINSHGLRGPERSWEKPQNTRRIVVLGDSFTFGLGVSDEKTYPFVLEKLLAEYSPPYEVLNMGVSDYGTDLEYLAFRRDGVRYSPDIVILAFYARNDFDDIVAFHRSVRGKPVIVDESLRPVHVPAPFFVRPPGSQGRFVHPLGLVDSSALYRLVFFSSVLSPTSSDVLAKLQLCRVTEEPDQVYQGSRADLAVAIVGGIFGICDDLGCPLVVMKFGAFLSERPSELDDEFSRKLVERLPEVHFLDVDQAFAERNDSARSLVLALGKDSHWNAFGNAQVAEILHQFLRDRGLLNPLPSRP